MNRESIIKLLDNFDGLVFVDEAYVDFSPEGSVIDLADKYPNLLVSRTFSKAKGMAGIRLGMGIAQEEIIQTLTKIKYPYNVNRLTQQAALDALKTPERVDQQVNILIAERQKLKTGLTALSFVKKVYPSDANFLLLEVSSAGFLIDFLKKKGIVIRNRSGVIAGKELVRITVGTPAQNEKLMVELKNFNNG
ncbi:MAG: aminotransferase class I/II-fold pyridoxal phosphate-dependent enzyme [Bacteroidales bacterium]|nr:aminotransferase class I/II-fold pyridoxal phosphate-dependent enzyme [Bacteroidales bacterium]